ncbi:MAG: insulinase family protein [Erysipelotrichaceae bacterium]|nr:insulinase family protein [Erysipelotrichaceae bacterium]
MQINDRIHGFKITNIRHIDEIKADLYEMIHEQTKARTIWLKRDDENKTFSIAFKTTPVDDTGVFHILEHSVLNGSKRYPVREPFVDLLKGSLQTFLNAMTYPDKTVYPVSSRNNKDFINLMRVYLDAVFYPNVLSNPNIFYQEGWHYELNDPKEDPIYKGVVFNEMKGAFSSPDGLRSRYMMHSLFPDTCYGNESGGDPEHITDLTYEQFCNAHRKHYSPSNSYIILDGDMDIEQVLGIINDEYLSHFDSEGEVTLIEKQKAVMADPVTIEFEVSPEESGEGKAQASYGYVIGDFNDNEKVAAFSLISSVLCGTNESPLKKAILSKGLAEDVSFDVQDGILQPFVEIDVINTDLEKEEEIYRTIREELERTIREGLDREELEATLNQREFKAKERDFGGAPKGLVFALSALDSWLYDGDPVDSICFDRLFDELRKKISTTYYEDLISDLILNSRHCAKVLLKPSNVLGQKKAEHEKEKLLNIASTWSDRDREELTEMNRRLQKWQAEEDTPEQKATLPALHLEDLKKTPTEYPLEVCLHIGTNTVLKHSNDTDGISYVTLNIEADDLELREYAVLIQLLSYLGKLKTEHYDPLTLSRLMKSILGDFSGSFSPSITYHSHDQKNVASISWSCLHRNDDEAVRLVKEILYTTDFSDKKAVRDILKQNIFIMEQGFINAGHSFALQRAAAHCSSLAIVSENAGGYEAYRYLRDLDENWETKADGFIAKLEELKKRLFIKERYTVSVASEDMPAIVKALLDDAPNGTVGETTEKKPLAHKREGIAVPANISYAAKSSALREDIKDLGVMYVISNILTYDYLWNNIRVKGGAYGCGFRCGFAKATNFYSYRDPNPANSLKIYRDVTEYLKEFCSRKDDIENYIVGTTGDFDPLLSVKSAIRASDTEYLMEISLEDKQEILNQILSADREKIREAIRLFEKMNQEDNVCVIGNRDALEKCKDQLDEIFDLSQKA